MSRALHVLSGARAGRHVLLDRPTILIGRHPHCDLQLDPEQDRDVSTRHAEVRQGDGQLVVRDLGSTNGTYVNGVRITGDHPLRDGDVIGLGLAGPQVLLRPVPKLQGEPGAGERVPDVPPPAAAPPRASGVARPAGYTQERIAMAVGASSRRWKRALAVTSGLLTAVALVVWWRGERVAAAQAEELKRAAVASDSLNARVERLIAGMAGRVAGLDSMIEATRRENESLRRRAGTAQGTAERASISEGMDRIATRQRALLEMDFTRIAEQNGRAIALVIVQDQQGRNSSGTAFGVTRDGRLVTNKHVVLDASGRPPAKIAVKYADTKEWWPARIVRTSPASDLALIQLEVEGSFPVVTGLSDGLAVVGAPVAVYGFPLGVDTPQDGRGLDGVAKATLAAGMVSKSLADVVQVDAFAAQGSSGSPLFDQRGRVAGVVYGGAPESNGRIVYAVPVARVKELLGS